MIKKLSSLLETAIVIGGLIAAPLVVLASLESAAAAMPDRPGVTVVQDFATPAVRTAAVEF